MAVDKREAVASLLLRLRSRGIIDKRLFTAFESVPRQNFVPIIYFEQCYQTGVFPIECGQTMTSADQVAKVLLAADIKASHRILEIGSGSGYQTALLSHLGKKVTSLERYRTLADKAKNRLETLKLTNALVTHNDGLRGVANSLFDRIILNGAVSKPPVHLIEQLASNGVLIAPVGPGDGVQEILKMTKIGSRFENEVIMTTRMQPLVSGVSKAI